MVVNRLCGGMPLQKKGMGEKTHVCEMEIVDVFCGVGGFSAGARDLGVPVLGIDNDDLMLRLWAANTKGRGNLAELWGETVDWPIWNDRQHVHLSPPCTALSKAQRDKATVARGIECLQRSLEFLRYHHPSSWSLETVATPVVQSCLRSFRDAHPEFDMTWAILDASDFGLPSTRVRLIAGPARLIRTLRETPVTRVSVQRAFASAGIDALPAQYVKNNSMSQTKEGVRRPCIRSVHQPCHTQTASHPLTWCTADGTTVRCLTVRETAIIMGFPSDWILPTSTRAAIRAIGNAVPPPLSRAIITAAAQLLGLSS